MGDTGHTGNTDKRTNQVQFVGELVREPRVFQTDWGYQVVNLFVKGDTQRGHVYLPVRITGELAETQLDTLVELDPGDQIKVLGELDWEKWEKNGQTRYATRINALKLKLPHKAPPPKYDEFDLDGDLFF